MILDQVYRNASTNFGDDPELRELLRQTFSDAEGPSPFSVNTLAGAPGAQSESVGQTFDRAMGFNQVSNQPKSGSIPPFMTSTEPAGNIPGSPMVYGQQAAPGKTDRGIQFSSQPITPEYLARLDQAHRAQQAGPAPQGGPTAVAGGPVAPPAARGAPTPQYPQVQPRSEIGAFLAGLGSSDAILPALGGGIRAVEEQRMGNTARNQTLRALINRGLDQDTALAAVNNPDLLKAILPRMFGTSKVQLGEIFDAQGRPQKVFYDEYGNARPIGGQGTGDYQKGLQRQGLDVIKGYREQANQAETMLAQLGQLEKARDSVSYEGVPFADAIARFMGWYGEGGGEDVRSAAANIQLNFTQQTKGAISDAEMDLFGLATPGLRMSDAGADRVIKAMKAANQRTIERNKFYQQWGRANNGDITGADTAWDQFIKQNPIIRSDESGNLVVQENNIRNWQNYLPGTVRGQAAMSGSAQAAPAAPGAAFTGGSSPADYGEMRPGMYQDPADGQWKWRDPRTGQVEIWEPPQ